jgi:hypothetical protein
MWGTNDFPDNWTLFIRDRFGLLLFVTVVPPLATEVIDLAKARLVPRPELMLMLSEIHFIPAKLHPL